MACVWRLLAPPAVWIASSGCAGAETVPASTDPCGLAAVALPDGSCVMPGVPAERCASGFEPDEGPSCRAVLPNAPCPDGTMAIPGEIECRRVAPCGPAPWGDIPIDGTTRFVDAAYAGGDGDGSQAKPFPTLQEAFLAAAPGALIALAAGSYQAYFDFQLKPVRLWGRCPELVEIVGPDPQFGAVIVVGPGASGTELHTLAVRGEGSGVVIFGATQVVLDRLWIHDSGGNGGIAALPLAGASEIRVEGSLVERASTTGITVDGSRAMVSDCAVRDTGPSASGGYGYGFYAIAGADGSASELELTGSLVERNRTLGLLAVGADALVEATVLRDTLPHAVFQLEGYGAGVQTDPMTNRRGNLVLRSSVVERNIESGVIASSGDLTIEWSRVRDTSPRNDGYLGRGVSVQVFEPIGTPSSAVLRESTLDHNAEFAILGIDSVVTLERVALLDTRVDDNGGFGDGLGVNPHDRLSEPTSATVSASRIAGNARTGIANFSAVVHIGATSLECNVIHLDGEAIDGFSFVYTDAGGNRCGCGDTTEECRVISSNFAPPIPP